MKPAIYITSGRPGTARVLKFGQENKFGAVCRDLLGVLLITAFFVLVFLLALTSTAGTAHAQQTIFNVPSSDVLNRGQVYVELDVPFKPNDGESVNRFSSFVPRVVVGVGGRTEAGLNITGNIQPGADVTMLVPAVKHRLYDGGDNGFTITVGDHLFIPVRNRDLVTYDVGNYVYGQVSRTFSSTRGTRITAGAYHFSRGVVAPDAQRAGGQFSFEQPVNSRFSILADYYTGRHAAGYFTPGFAFKPHPRVTGYVGYSIGNDRPGQGNNFFLLEIGYNFY